MDTALDLGLHDPPVDGIAQMRARPEHLPLAYDIIRGLDQIVIIGGGPAGSTAGRLLAEWGHTVTIHAPPSDPRRALGECLPPSNRKLFQFLGILDAIDAAGFYRTTGNTVWWGGDQRIEMYPDGYGYQVPRPAFDRVLLDLARAAGARVRRSKAPEELGDRFVIDCSGRAGVLSRRLGLRRIERRMVATCAVLDSSTGWRLPDPTHTLVEQTDFGWAWSVPVSPERRFLAFMSEKKVDFDQ